MLKNKVCKKKKHTLGFLCGSVFKSLNLRSHAQISSNLLNSRDYKLLKPYTMRLPLNNCHYLVVTSLSEYFTYTTHLLLRLPSNTSSQWYVTSM